MDIGRKIYEIRRREGMSQSEFAEKFNVTRQTVSHWENGRNYPDMGTLMRISDEYNITFDDLIKNDRDLMNKIDRSRLLTSRGSIILGILWAVVILTLIIKFTPVIVSKFYYDPCKIIERSAENSENSMGVGYELVTTRLERDTRMYSELFLPENRLEYAEAVPLGWGRYDFVLTRVAEYDVAEEYMVAGRIERNKMQVFEPDKYIRPNLEVFSRNSINSDNQSNEKEDLKRLDDNRLYKGYITLGTDMDYDAAVKWIEHYNVEHSWAYIVTDTENDDILGMYTKPYETEEAAREHFAEMLQYFSDNPEYIGMLWEDTSDMYGTPLSRWIPDKIRYIDNNGLNVRGLAVMADKNTLLEISDSEYVINIVTAEA